MTSSHQLLQTVFQELDYLDDGYQDGYVSHVGLRRIVLETPELEDEIGATLTRALLVRAEQNLYGRLTFEEFLILAREVAQYTQGLSTRRPQVAQSAMRPKNHVHNAAVRIAIPVAERDERISYLDQYSCRPPPLFLLLLSLAQICVFIWHVIALTNQNKRVGPNGPPYLGVLIFNPDRKFEVWRFLSYMFVHSGYFHIIFNILMQLLLGIPLEMVHRWWRILLIYVCGVVAGSLCTSITDPDVYLAGASGGVYAIIAAHLANVVFNWSEMEFPFLRLLAFLILTGVDTSVAIYYRYLNVDTKVSYVAHIAGAVAGFLLGIVVLKNLRVKTWERAMWWIALLLFLGLFLGAIVWNAVLIGLD